MTAVLHPEWVGGRRLWIDPAMQDVIDKMHHGDPVLGWEGDDRLAVYGVPTEHGVVWDLMRLDEDNKYRRVTRTQPGAPFDENVIRWLVAHDRRRKPDDWDIAKEIEKTNDARDAAIDAEHEELVREELAPRLWSALRKEAGW